ncbi:MAG: diguanylate cyclase [Oscillospiraceae bacterium]|nr:diguanylate cyclase [Oscillospiraceae bacterium]
MKEQNNIKRSLLIIDDSPLNIAVLQRILGEDYQIYTAWNGIDGLKAAKEHEPDVIILDIIMPKMDGYQTIALLKEDVHLQNIPVIFITGLTDRNEEEKALALGGADFIVKPFNPAIVKLRVGSQIRILNYISQIERMGLVDSMTGIANRRGFDERLYSEWKRTIREEGEISILAIDIDFFKKYNDTYGHLNGDLVLKTIADVIAQTLKRPGDFAARWGGEEFIALLPDTDLKGATAIAEQVRANIEKTTVTLRDGRNTYTTVSIGVNTQKPSADCCVDDFLHDADEALYKAKADGRNRVCLYSDMQKEEK